MKHLRTICLGALPLAAVGSIAFGFYAIYPPAAFIVVGALVLVDLTRKDKDKTP